MLVFRVSTLSQRCCFIRGLATGSKSNGCREKEFNDFKISSKEKEKKLRAGQTTDKDFEGHSKVQGNADELVEQCKLLLRDKKGVDLSCVEALKSDSKIPEAYIQRAMEDSINRFFEDRENIRIWPNNKTLKSKIDGKTVVGRPDLVLEVSRDGNRTHTLYPVELKNSEVCVDPFTSTGTPTPASLQLMRYLDLCEKHSTAGDRYICGMLDNTKVHTLVILDTKAKAFYFYTSDKHAKTLMGIFLHFNDLVKFF
jgi:hypothetical protein